MSTNLSITKFLIVCFLIDTLKSIFIFGEKILELKVESVDALKLKQLELDHVFKIKQLELEKQQKERKAEIEKQLLFCFNKRFDNSIVNLDNP
jgi:hypothetical protein